MVYIDAKEDEVIPLGRQGENEVTTVLFDVSGWADEYGDGEFTLLHERCMDTAPYECPITIEDDVISWVIRNVDTAYPYSGRAQLIYIVNDYVAKSVIYKTFTIKSIDGDPVFPDPYDDWLRQMHEDAEYVRENIEDALEAKQITVESAAAAAEDAEAAARSAVEAAAYVGSPLVATLQSAMTNTSKVYVYVGSESGMSAGHWYYYNGSSWADGGVYNSIADDVATNADIDALIFS